MESKEAGLRERLRAAGFDPGTDLPPAFAFGDSPEMADRLADLVRRGLKTATSSLGWEYEAEGSPLPRVGDRMLLVDGRGEPVAILETTEVRRLPFDAVDAAFAADEGEGDRSLSSWREGHWRFFSRICAAIGRTPSPQMPIACVRFRAIVTLG